MSPPSDRSAWRRARERIGVRKFKEEGAAMNDAEVTPAPSQEADLSEEVAATIERETGDRVRCTRIGGSKYRCNWWAARTGATFERGAVNGLASTMFRVRKSRMLHVTRSAAGLRIMEVPARLQ
jgi:hypothetical protein